MKVALLQFAAGSSKEANLKLAATMAEQAMACGARFVLLPEVFNYRGEFTDKVQLAATAEKVPGPTTKVFSLLARRYKSWILLGSIIETAKENRAYNTSILLDPEGKITAKYRKIHLFDARISDKIIKETDCFNAGRRPVRAEVDGFRVGLTVCYDLRFPDFYQGYARRGVEVLTVPSCFTRRTGQSHWETLLRARAIENLAYVLAPNQIGTNSRGVQAHGHSMIISPWGDIIAEAGGETQEIIYGELSRDKIDEARKTLPGIIKS